MTIQNSNPIATIIAASMKDATTQGNRQAALTVAMFESEATFSTDFIMNIMRKEGKEKTAAIDSALSAISDDFASFVDEYERRTDKTYRKGLKAADKEKNALECAALFNKIRAARIMFTRAMAATYQLRMAHASKVKLANIGTGTLLVHEPSEEFEGAMTTQRYSNTELMNAGDKAIREALGKVTAPGRARNPNAAHALADGAKSLAAVLSTLGNDGKRKPIEDYAGAVSNDMETVLRELFLAKFYDGNVFDKATFNDWLAEVTPKREATKETKAA